MYQALYRKWRPKTFDQVLGQEHITETLKNQVQNDRLSHAYLFIGTRGTGKTTCARILARAVNCEHPVNGNPCGECPSCRGILDGSILDVVELDAASNNGVDNVRALREEAVFSPTRVKKRVYIIDEVHMLSLSAFNALLKILEEPPEHLMFILATTELNKVPATILSRCQRHSFRRIDAEALAGYLGHVAASEGWTLTEDAAGLIARLADGGVRDALSILDQCSAAEKIDTDAVYSAMGMVGNRRTVELLQAVLRHDAQAAIRGFAAMWMDGKDPATLLGELNGLLRDILMLQVAGRNARDLLSGFYEPASLADFAGQMTREELLCAMDTVQRCLGSLRDVHSVKNAVELCLVSLCDNTAGESVASLRARISRLEEQLARGVAFAPAQRPAEPEDWEEERPPVCEADEEDELDPAEFAEEQPEEELERYRAETPEPATAPKPEPEAKTEPEPAISWKELSERAAESLGFPEKLLVQDESKARGFVEGGILRIEVYDDFLFPRLNRQEVLGAFAAAAKALSGRELHVQLSEGRKEQRQQRSLDELRAFPEVHFSE